MRPIDKTPWRKLMISDSTCYGVARNFLLTTTGYYCAYCEAPLGVDMPVEHKVPKGGENDPDANCFPEMATKYFNFVLACSACNSTKGAHPNRKEALEFLAITFPDLEDFDENDQIYGALASMVWPDFLTKNGGGPDVPPFLAGFFAQGNPTYKLFKYAKAQKTQLQLCTDGMLTLSLSDKTKAWAAIPRTMVWITPNEDYITTLADPDTWRRRVKNTLTTLDINYYNPDDPKASDRRTKDRTAVWDIATGALAELAAAVTQNGLISPIVADVFNSSVYLVVQTIRELALSTGHWSVWMAVFDPILKRAGAPWNDDALVPDGKEKDLVRSLFVQYLDWEDKKRVYSFQLNPPQIFLGTSIDRVPL